MTVALSDIPMDLARIRADFPILAREIYGRPLIYLDNAASAQKPKQVIDRMRQAYQQEYANVHRGLHYLSNLATQNYEEARDKVTAFVNAADRDEIIFTGGATEAINLVAYAYGVNQIAPGDEIILSVMEHHSNIVPWHFLRERYGAKLVWVDVRDDGALDREAFEAAFSSRTKMVAITHMSNVLGTVTPIKELVKVAHAHGVPVLVDGSQAAVHCSVDVQDLDCDFYAFTGHKLYGPSGIGVLYGKKHLLNEMAPFNGGGEMISEVTQETVTYNEAPHRFEAGTPPIVQAIGLGAAVDYVRAIGWQVIEAHERALADYAMRQLSEVDGVQIYGTVPDKGAVISFNVMGAHAHDVSAIVDRYGVAIRAGTHCAQPLLARYGQNSTCRASFAMYNDFGEVDALVEALQKARSFFC